MCLDTTRKRFNIRVLHNFTDTRFNVCDTSVEICDLLLEKNER